MSDETKRTEWRVLWSDGMDDLLDNESEAIEWVARFSGESDALTGSVEVRTVTTLFGDWEPTNSSSLVSREHVDIKSDASTSTGKETA